MVKKRRCMTVDLGKSGDILGCINFYLAKGGVICKDICSFFAIQMCFLQTFSGLLHIIHLIISVKVF